MDFAALRSAMVVSQLRTSDVSDPAVVAAMARVPREQYLPATLSDRAYIDRVLPTGNGRAINPPLATGRLLVAAQVKAGDKVLLIGSAGGYAAAVLAALGARVVAVESDDSLAGSAPLPAGVTLVRGDLAAGALAHAPYHVLLIDGAVERIPDALIAQLRNGSRIATGIVERGVTRLMSGQKVGKAVGLTSLYDMDMAILPGFALPRGFVF